MKTFYLAAALAALCGVEATTLSTVVCADCPSTTPGNDIVTRSALPTPSCTEAPLSVVTKAANRSITTTTGDSSPTGPPTSGANRMVGGITGAVLLMGAAYLV